MHQVRESSKVGRVRMRDEHAMHVANDVFQGTQELQIKGVIPSAIQQQDQLIDLSISHCTSVPFPRLIF